MAELILILKFKSLIIHIYYYYTVFYVHYTGQPALASTRLRTGGFCWH